MKTKFISKSILYLLVTLLVTHFSTLPLQASSKIKTSETVVSEIEEPQTPQEVQEPQEQPKDSKEIKENKLSELAIKSLSQLTSEEIIQQAWEFSSNNNLEELDRLIVACLEFYGEDAKLQHQELTDFPIRTEAKNYQSLNDVATCLFIKAESQMNNGLREKAIEGFQHIIDNYKWSQAWDPRGWYWSVAEKSQASIDVLTGKKQEEIDQAEVKINRTRPSLVEKGTENIIDYSKYGKFINVGTEKYHYSITDMQGLTKAIGEGIYPNTSSIFNNPRFKKLKKEGRLEGSQWDYVNTDDLEAAFFKWATAHEPWGIRLFYIGMIFEKAEMYYEALRAYHALVVHYPKTVAWTYWQTPWYPGQVAIAKIRHIIRIRPELHLQDKWMKIEVENGFDNEVKNDIFISYPGKILEKSLMEKVKDRFLDDKASLDKVKKELGKGTVRLVQYENDHWQMLVNDKPYIIKGVTYAPTKIGQSPDKGSLENWMEQDTDDNGLIDGPYDSWVDKNRNNKRDEDEAVVGDFQLMKDMGVNTIRVYHVPDTPNKKLLREMYEKYGIRVIMGDFLGKYAIGSGAKWSDGTDYENEEHKKKMLDAVKGMVNEFKDEPYILMWLLGNENNYGVACNADKKPEAYFKFADEVAQWIKSVDKNHPVAISNGDTLFLDLFAQNAPNIDIFAANVYRGNYGFDPFWEQIQDASGKPAFITEYGCPAFAKHLSLEEAEKAQADYHEGNWLDIARNTAGSQDGVGNALGGIVFEWMDEWWKNYEPYLHDRASDAVGPFPGGFYYEEWFGIVSQGNGRKSPFLRQLRKAYFSYQEMWNQ